MLGDELETGPELGAAIELEATAYEPLFEDPLFEETGATEGTEGVECEPDEDVGGASGPGGAMVPKSTRPAR